ncbi:MAG: cation:proton antiporter subunit C [Dermatophilaceae bacterium]
MAIAITVGLLIAGGVFMILRRGMVRIVVGFLLLSHAVNLLLLNAGGLARRHPALGSVLDPDVSADPLPQALVLTAIVIAFAITIFMLVLAVIGEGDDDTEVELAGREEETAQLLPPDHPAYRRNAPQDWHAYLDRADDTDPDDPRPDDSGVDDSRGDRPGEAVGAR